MSAQGALLAVMSAAAIGYGLYLVGFNLLTSSREASIENNQLIIKTTAGRVITAIALDEPFVAKCVHYDGKVALYRVTQNKKTARFALSRTDGGEVVRALKLPWPPSTTPYGSWTR